MKLTLQVSNKGQFYLVAESRVFPPSQLICCVLKRITPYSIWHNLRSVTLPWRTGSTFLRKFRIHTGLGTHNREATFWIYRCRSESERSYLGNVVSDKFEDSHNATSLMCKQLLHDWLSCQYNILGSGCRESFPRRSGRN